MNEWALVAIGIFGIFSGLIGQALYWGYFKGKIETRAETIESDVSELKSSRSEMWTEINDHGQRIARVEATCKIRHHEEKP